MRAEGTSMAPRAIFLLVIGSLLVVTHQQRAGNKMDSPKIPDYLEECYQNQTLYERDQRIPSTMSILIAIIRKLENAPGLNMDMRTLATTIIRTYKIDGIVRDPRITADGVIPFGPNSDASYRQRFLFDNLLPSTGNVIPNGTLTSEEKCALHFMLSSSLDVWDRQDSCTSTSTYSGRRVRRQADDDTLTMTQDEDVDEEDNPTDEKEGDEVQEGSPKPIPTVVVEQANDTNSSEETTSNAKVEDDEKDKANSQEKRPDNEPVHPPVLKRMSAKMVMPPVQRSGKMVIDYPRSECPVENGVVYTSSGAVSAGITITAIAAGLQPQSVSVQRLLESIGKGEVRRGSSRGSLSTTDSKVSNLWLSTLSGDLAEAALYQGPVSNGDINIGGSGGWNDTAMPRWYFLKSKEQLDITDAEIRGGIDGLIIGKNINDWNSAFGNSLRLSQILDMYYSYRGITINDKKYRACNRKDYFPEVAPSEEMKAQAFSAAKVLLNIQRFSIIGDDLLQSYTDKAAQMLTSYIPSGLVDQSCPNTLRQSGRRYSSLESSPLSKPSVDLVVVVDSGWPYQNILSLLTVLNEAIDLTDTFNGDDVGGQGGSRVTLMYGKDGTSPAVLNQSTSPLDLQGNFTSFQYTGQQSGINMVSVMTRIRTMFAWSMQDERQRKVTTGRPQVVLFLPYTSFSMSDSDRSKTLTLVKRINTKTPDVNLLFMSYGAKDPYADFVADKEKDLFQISSVIDFKPAVNQLVMRLQQFKRRIINPACTYKWDLDGDSGRSVQYADPVMGSLTFRVLPNYFFKSEKATVKFQGRGDGTLNVCYSRQDILTGSITNSSSSSGSTTCKTITSDTVEFSESQPCSGSSTIVNCNPFYFSVSATSTNKQCQGCRYPDMVRFTVTHDGLTCASGAKGLLTSGMAVTLLIILFSAREAMSRFMLSG